MAQDKKVKILDCTIRDGGYLNDWHFDLKLVRELYRAHSRSGVDFVEIGFRSSDKYFAPEKYGPWRFTPESLLSEVVKGISGPAVSLMVDFGKVDIEDIPDRKNSIASMYRVARFTKIKPFLPLSFAMPSLIKVTHRPSSSWVL